MPNTLTRSLILGLILLLSSLHLFPQNPVKRPEITAGIGPGVNMASQETGMGIVYSLGWEKSLTDNQRLRIHPHILFGGFRPPFFVSDARDQHYRSSALNLAINYDLIKRSSGSIYLSGGGFVNYSRGLLGTGGGEDGYKNSEYFHSFYFGGSFSLGIRLTPVNSRLTYDIKAFNFMIGNNSFVTSYALIQIGFRIAK